jgi:N-acylneuraminate cytidylyltransferase
MIGLRRVLGLIPARGGSKGLPGKNIADVDGRPLIDWTVSAALASKHIDRVVLSSDDDAIAEAARRCGCEVPFRRPPELATDSASTLDVVLHALDALPGFDVVVLLQPTSPLRTSADIDAACELFANGNASSCVSVSEVEQHPYWMYQIDAHHRLAPLLEVAQRPSRRQDLPAIYALNGAVYVTDVAALRAARSFVTADTVAYVMPPSRALDIDTRADLDAFRLMLRKDSHVQVPTSS